jgi:hypothetical protein
MFKKFILHYFCLAFISLWLVNVYTNCEYIYDKYKTNTIACSIVRVDANSSSKSFEVKKSSQNIGQELSHILSKAVDTKFEHKMHKYKLCSFCYSEQLINSFSYNLASIPLKIKINILNNILVLSSCFVSSCRYLEKLWFYHKAHSPPIFN